MVGLALVTTVAVLAQGLRDSFEGAVKSEFHADYALTSQDTFTPTSVDSATALREVGDRDDGRRRTGRRRPRVRQDDPGDRRRPRPVEDAAVEVEDRDERVARRSRRRRRDRRQGLRQVPSPLRRLADQARDARRQVPRPEGQSDLLAAAGRLSARLGDDVVGGLRLRLPEPAEHLHLRARAGRRHGGEHKATQRGTELVPNAKVQTEQQFIHNQEKGLDIFLNLLYILLGLAIIVSLFGIVNTLVLTIFERTREIGMLRAVGMTRRQSRRMIRHESVVTALIGAALGIPIGIGLAALFDRAIGGVPFVVPWGTIVVFVVAAIIVGLIAAIFPARRASHLNVLDALQYE